MLRPKKYSCSHQQLLFATVDDNSVVPQSVAGRTVFQVDQAAPEDKELLWYLGKRCEDTSLDSSFGICTRSNYEKASQPPGKSLHNFTDFERISFRKNTTLSAGYSQQLQKPRPSIM